MRRRRTRRSASPSSLIATLVVTATIGLLAACADSVSPVAPSPIRQGLPVRSVPADVLTADLAEVALVNQAQSPDGWPGLGQIGEHVYVADDFVIRPGHIWTISKVLRPGFLQPDNPTGLIEIAFHANVAGKPGSQIVSFTSTPVSSTTRPGCTFCVPITDHVYQLPTPLQLGQGTYWLRTECSNSFFLCWINVDVIGSPYQLIGLDGQWGDNIARDDLAFALLGTETITTEQRLTELNDAVAALNLPDGLGTALGVKLRDVTAALGAGDTAAACTALQSFVNQVSAQSGKKLTTQQATDLIAAANAIRQQLACL